MQNFFSKRNILIGIFSAFFFINVQAQALWDIGVKGGSNFYLGDLNPTLFNNPLQPVFGGYVRGNINARWATKLQFMHGKITDPFDQTYNEISIQQEFNFFEYGLKPYYELEYIFSPYICAGLGLSFFNTANGESIITPDLPFGVGVKYKPVKFLNLGLEWTMHKLFSDSFDSVDNPYEMESSNMINNDWYSMFTFTVGIDLGDRHRFCKR